MTPPHSSGKPRWNTIDDAVTWAMHELRRLCSQPEFGTRTIARHLVRNTIKVSRSWVQQQLRKPVPVKPMPRKSSWKALMPPEGRKPHHLLAPSEINQVWHTDLCSLRILWVKFTVIALLDGYSRKLLALRVCRGSATSKQVIAVLQESVRVYGQPKFLITDHGCQFRTVFKQAVGLMGITPIQGRVRQPNFNGKVERFFRTFRGWQRLQLLPMSIHFIGEKVRGRGFQGWYNEHRPHAAHGVHGLTPEEVWRGAEPIEPISFRARDQESPTIQVKRRSCRGDPSLPMIEIKVAA